MKANELWPGMTRIHHKALQQYLRALADELGLRDWSIELHDQLDTDECYASTTCTKDSQAARIALGERFVNDPPATQRETLLHELLHCHFDAGHQFVLDSMGELIGRPAVTVLDRGLRSHVERTVDAIAVAIAPRFPLPPRQP